MDGQLLREFEYYRAHQDELVATYNGKWVVIKDGKVFGAFEDQISAVEEGCKQYELGTFLVQKVEPGEGSYTQSFHSRVAFT